jgi:hypothetical protein
MSEAPEQHVCATPGCGKPAKMACPTCKKLDLPPSFFCTQECFKSVWEQHKVKHVKHAKGVNVQIETGQRALGAPVRVEDERARIISLLPFFHLRLKDDYNYLSAFSVNTIQAGSTMPTGSMLKDLGIVKYETDDSKFVRNVVLFEELHDQRDHAVVDIHREAIRLLCGEEDVAAVETHKRIGTSLIHLSNSTYISNICIYI